MMYAPLRVFTLINTFCLFCFLLNHTSAKTTTGNPHPDIAAKETSVSTCSYLVGYWQNWTNASSPYIPLDQIDPRYNVVNLSFAIPGGGTDYDMTFSLCCGETQAGLISKIQTLQAAGVIVNISIGGANDPVHLDNTTEVNAFVASMDNIINTYGFDGLDIDLEGSSLSVSGGSTIANPIDATVVNFIDAIQQIAANYQTAFGKKIFLSAAPETAFVQGGMSSWGGLWGAYLPVLDALRNELDLLHVQLYNSGSMYGIDGGIYSQGTADFIVSQAEAVIVGFNAGAGGFFSGFPAAKVAVGLPACPSAAGGGFTSTTTVKAALDYLMGNGGQPGSYVLQQGPYPDFGGMMTWSVNWDAVSNCNATAYEFATNFETIFSDNCTAVCAQPNLGADLSACGLMFPYLLNSNTPTNPDVSFTWTNLTTGTVLVSNDPAANTFAIATAGTYEVSRDSSGCIKTDVINLSEDFTIPDIPAALELCNTVPENIAVANVAGFPAGTTWAWYKDNTLLENETSASYGDVRSAGIYKVVATYANCTSEKSTTITSGLPEPIDACGGAGEAVTLGINTTDAGPFNWYDAANAGLLLGTGTTFTTPLLNSTTTYYVEAEGNGGAVGNAITGPALAANGPGTLNNWTATSEIYFDVESNIVLKGCTVYPLIWNCSTHSITLEFRDAAGTLLPNGTQSFSLQGTNCSGPSGAIAITLTGGGVVFAPGAGYKITATGPVILNHWSGPAPYPMSYSPYFTITGGNNGNTYMAMHDWVVEGAVAGCARLPVVATVDPACGTVCPAFLELNDLPIAGNTYHAMDSIHAAGKVANGTTVHLRAGSQVLLSGGFEVEPGGEFSVAIEECLD